MAGSTGLTSSQPDPGHAMYHHPAAPPGSAPAKRDGGWAKPLAGYPLPASAEINLSGGLPAEKQLVYSAQNQGTILKGKRFGEHVKLAKNLPPTTLLCLRGEAA